MVEVLLTEIHACREEKDGSTEKFCTSGIVTVNALSLGLKLRTIRDGHIWETAYLLGKVEKPLTDLGEAAEGERGSTLSFVLDPSILGFVSSIPKSGGVTDYLAAHAPPGVVFQVIASEAHRLDGEDTLRPSAFYRFFGSRGVAREPCFAWQIRRGLSERLCLRRRTIRLRRRVVDVVAFWAKADRRGDHTSSYVHECSDG